MNSLYVIHCFASVCFLNFVYFDQVAMKSLYSLSPGECVGRCFDQIPLKVHAGLPACDSRHSSSKFLGIIFNVFESEVL